MIEIIVQCRLPNFKQKFKNETKKQKKKTTTTKKKQQKTDLIKSIKL
jgi:hypothetical protein